MKIVVSEKAVREYIKEMMENPSVGWQSQGDMSSVPAQVSAVVDPSAASTNPSDENFKPQNRAELKAALSTIVDDISDDEAPEFYSVVKDAAIELKNEDDKMEKDNAKDVKTVEETIRRTIRKILSEFGPYRDTGLSFSGYEFAPDSDEEDEEVGPAKKKNVTMTDVGGASLHDIQKEMGYASESGVRQAIEKILEKARFTGTMDPDELDIFILTTMNDYIEQLSKAGDLTAADVELLKAHPQLVADLDSFRVFLGKAIKRARKSDQKLINPVKESDGEKEEKVCKCGSNNFSKAPDGSKICKDCKLNVMEEGSPKKDVKVCKCGSENFTKAPDGSKICKDCKKNVMEEGGKYSPKVDELSKYSFAEECPKCDSTNTEYDEPIPSMQGFGQDISLHCNDCRKSYSQDPFTGQWIIPGMKKNKVSEAMTPGQGLRRNRSHMAQRRSQVRRNR